jgi:hypothetical protein
VQVLKRKNQLSKRGSDNERREAAGRNCGNDWAKRLNLSRCRRSDVKVGQGVANSTM